MAITGFNLQDKVLNTIHSSQFKKTVELCLVLIFITLTILNSIIYIDRYFEANIGYMDTMANIHCLDNILADKIPFRDFYRPRGPLLLYLEALPYKFLGQNHYANSLVLYLILPITSLILLYLWAKIFLKTSCFVILFLVVTSFQNLFWQGHPALRITAPAIALGLFIIASQKFNKNYFYFSGLLSGASLFISLEYGSALILTTIFAFIISILMGNNRHKFKSFTIFWILGVFTIVLPFSSFLLSKGALTHFLKYTFGYISAFSNYSDPTPFPSLPRINFSGLSAFGISLWNFLLSVELRFYIPLLIYLISFCVLITKRGWNNLKVSILPLVLFGLIMFKRPLSTPQYSYLLQAILPAITISFIFLELLFLKIVNYLDILKKHHLNFRILGKISFFSIFLFGTMCWFCLTREKGDGLYSFAQAYRIFSPRSWIFEHKDSVFYKRVGYFVSPKTVMEYEQIINYIETHTDKNDYVYIYPWGAYNHFTKRRSPVKMEVLFNDLADPEYYDNELLNELKDKKPKYVVVNLFNNLGIVRLYPRGDISDYLSWRETGSLAFINPVDKEPVIEKYILENYTVEKQFDYAAVMSRRENKRIFKRNFEQVFLWDKNNHTDYFLTNLLGHNNLNSFKFRIKDKHPSVLIKLDSPVSYTHIELKCKVIYPSWNRFFAKPKLHIYISDQKDPTDYTLLCTIPLPTKGNKFKRFEYGSAVTQKTASFIILQLEAPGPFNFYPREFEIESLSLLNEHI